MKFVKNFKSQAEGIGYTAKTPFVSTVKGVNKKVLYIPQSVGGEVELTDDGDGFIKYKVPGPTPISGPANNEIWYWTNDEQLITIGIEDGYDGPIPTSNTYENGKGIMTFAEDVTKIGNWAFYIDSYGDHSEQYGIYNNLIGIQIPNSVTSIGVLAFSECSGLTNVIMGNSVTSIGDLVFQYCTSLTSITIPNSVTSIGERVFEGCSSLVSITIPNSVTSIGYAVFSNCTSLTSITIPNSITSIDESVFSGCTSLTSITIPDSVTSIGGGVFFNCTSLTSITIPNSVTSIGGSVFEGCSSLTSITIPDSVTSITNLGIDDCSSLTSITVEAITPPTLEYIGRVPSTGYTIYVPAGSVDAYKTANNWSTYADIIQAIS